ncbi:MAG: citrate synthase family protein [Myxococcota bacterium]
MSSRSYLTADEAVALLGVRKPTLYAYVSRGLIRSRAVAGSRAREYAAADVRRMVAGKQARRNPRKAVREALGMRGLPVLRSSLSAIEGGRLYYRGHEVTELAAAHDFESVVGMLWGAWPAEVLPPRGGRRGGDAPLLARLQQRVIADDARDPAARSLQPPSVRRVGASMLRRMVAEVCGVAPSTAPLAEQLAHAWGVSSPDVLDAALILCADHGLNVSAFTARCVASAGASAPMVVAAGLAALSGRRHGGHTPRVAAMFDARGPVVRIIARHVERDGELPGFGHALYPHGDPRASALLSLARPSPALRRARRFVQAAGEQVGVLPTLDFGLVTLCRSVGAPADAPLALFALGRTAGWVAHALEQYETGTLIRPRAEYVGPSPDAPDAWPAP